MEPYILQVQIQRYKDSPDSTIEVRWNKKLIKFSTLSLFIQTELEMLVGVETVTMYNYCALIDWADWAVDWGLLTKEIEKVFDKNLRRFALLENSADLQGVTILDAKII